MFTGHFDLWRSTIKLSSVAKQSLAQMIVEKVIFWSHKPWLTWTIATQLFLMTLYHTKHTAVLCLVKKGWLVHKILSGQSLTLDGQTGRGIWWYQYTPLTVMGVGGGVYLGRICQCRPVLITMFFHSKFWKATEHRNTHTHTHTHTHTYTCTHTHKPTTTTHANKQKTKKTICTNSIIVTKHSSPFSEKSTSDEIQKLFFFLKKEEKACCVITEKSGCSGFSVLLICCLYYA